MADSNRRPGPVESGLNVALFPVSAVAAAALAMALSAIVVALLVQGAARLPHDRPSARSLHDLPVPRAGGLAIWAGFLPVALLVPAPVPGGPGWLIAWLAVAGVSLVDDWRGVHPAIRLLVQALAAVAVAGAIHGSDAAAMSTGALLSAIAGVTIAIIWSANLFNFMDGSDGLAAAMAISGFGAYGVAAVQAGAPAQVYFALAAATLPFLAVNLPPARTFMGDVGAVPLGFLAAVFGVAGCRGGVWPAWFPLLVFLPFIADATLTLAQRRLRGERVWQAHKAHYYQRLNQLGAGHRGTLLAYGALMAGAAATAVAALAARPAYGWGALLGWIVVVAAFFARIDYHWTRRKPAP
jgi:UDP-N-acetylmuramyl pentapeptide phosphotransferase/UDP-N-acetylglucosamine-1-phosphate transferase